MASSHHHHLYNCGTCFVLTFLVAIHSGLRQNDTKGVVKSNKEAIPTFFKNKGVLKSATLFTKWNVAHAD